MADAAFLEDLFARLNDLLPADDSRWALLKVSASDYEIRTITGAVGRGATVAGAVGQLTHTYGRQRQQMDGTWP